MFAFHYVVRAVVISLVVVGIGACAARPLPTALELPAPSAQSRMNAPPPLAIPEPSDAGTSATPATSTCTIQGSGWTHGGWSGELLVRLAPADPPRIQLRTPQVQGVTWTNLPPPEIDRVASVELALSGVHIAGFAPIRGREMRIASRAYTDDRLVWAQPGRRAAVKGTRDGDAILELETELAAPKTLAVRIPCAELISDDRAQIDPDTAPPGSRMLPSGPALHLRARPAGPIGYRLQLATPVTMLEKRDGFAHVSGVTDTIGFEGWVREDEIVYRGYGLGGYGSGHGRMGTRCAPGTDRVALRATRLMVGSTPSTPVGMVDQDATLIEKSRSGEWTEVQIPPCALVPAIDGESFWVRAADLR